MNTNWQNMPVGSSITATNEDGSVSIMTLTGREVYDVRLPGLFLVAVVALLALFFWLVGRRKLK